VLYFVILPSQARHKVALKAIKAVRDLAPGNPGGLSQIKRLRFINGHIPGKTGK
jgi:hypothetical protein